MSLTPPESAHSELEAWWSELQKGLADLEVRRPVTQDGGKGFSVPFAKELQAYLSNFFRQMPPSSAFHKEASARLLSYLQKELSDFIQILEKINGRFSEEFKVLGEKKYTGQQLKELDAHLKEIFNAEFGNEKSDEQPFDLLIILPRAVVSILESNARQSSLEEYNRILLARSYFIHSLSGVELMGLNTLLAVSDFDEISAQATDSGKNAELTSNTDFFLSYAAIGSVAFLKILGCCRLLQMRLGGDLDAQKLTLQNFDLLELAARVGMALQERFNNVDGPRFHDFFNVQIHCGKDEHCDAQITGEMSLIFVLLYELLKNSFKIMHERKIPSEQQRINIYAFEESDVLFLHVEDQAGGFDLTELLYKGVEKVRENMRGELGPVLRVIQGGSFQAARRLTMQDLCSLVFEEQLSARQGGSGLGLAEGQKILGMHGAYVKAVNHFRRGVQFLLAFPKNSLPPDDVEAAFVQAEARLDRAEVERLGFSQGNGLAA